MPTYGLILILVAVIGLISDDIRVLWAIVILVAA